MIEVLLTFLSHFRCILIFNGEEFISSFFNKWCNFSSFPFANIYLIIKELDFIFFWFKDFLQDLQRETCQSWMIMFCNLDHWLAYLNIQKRRGIFFICCILFHEINSKVCSLFSFKESVNVNSTLNFWDFKITKSLISYLHAIIHIIVNNKLQNFHTFFLALNHKNNIRVLWLFAGINITSIINL